MSTLSDRARELLEWLRRELWIANKCVAALAECQGYQTALLSQWKHTAALFKSRAAALESLLAENERLRAALQRIANLPLGRDGNQTVRARRIAIAALGGDPGSTPRRAASAAQNVEPAALPNSVPGQAEPESDPGLPASSPPDIAAVAEQCAEIAERHGYDDAACAIRDAFPKES